MFASKLAYCQLQVLLGLIVYSLLERTACDTSTTFARWNVYSASTAEAPVMKHECAVATHTGVTTVKHGRFVDVVSMRKPVPVLQRLVQ